MATRVQICLSTRGDMDRTFNDAIYALRQILKYPTAEIQWTFSSARIITKAMRMRKHDEETWDPTSPPTTQVVVTVH